GRVSRATLSPYTSLFRSRTDLRAAPTSPIRGVHSPGLTSPYEPLPPRLVRWQQIRPRLWITMAIIVVVLLAGIGGYAYSNRSTPDRKSTRLNSSHVAISY